MKKKIYHILDKKNNNHEFTIEVEEKKNSTAYSLFRGSNTKWTDPGEFLFKVKDHRNGLKFKDFHFDKNMDYEQFDNLAVMIKAIKKLDPDMGPCYSVNEIIEL